MIVRALLQKTGHPSMPMGSPTSLILGSSVPVNQDIWGGIRVTDIQVSERACYQ